MVPPPARVTTGAAPYARGVRRLVSPLWLLWHTFAAAAVVAMVFLGRWQLHRAFHTHSVQNYGYAGEWWLFALFGVGFWVKTVREAVRPAGAAGPAAAWYAESPVAARALPIPAARAPLPSVEDDPEVAAYNDYLAYLAAHPRR